MNDDSHCISSSSSSSSFISTTYNKIHYLKNTIQHHLQNTLRTYNNNKQIYNNQICVGKSVNRSVVLIYGSFIYSGCLKYNTLKGRVTF